MQNYKDLYVYFVYQGVNMNDFYHIHHLGDTWNQNYTVFMVFVVR